MKGLWKLIHFAKRYGVINMESLLMALELFLIQPFQYLSTNNETITYNTYMRLMHDTLRIKCSIQLFQSHFLGSFDIIVCWYLSIFKQGLEGAFLLLLLVAASSGISFWHLSYFALVFFAFSSSWASTDSFLHFVWFLIRITLLSYFCSSALIDFVNTIAICRWAFSLFYSFFSSDFSLLSFAMQTQAACLIACTFPDARFLSRLYWDFSYFCHCLAFSLAFLITETCKLVESLHCINNHLKIKQFSRRIKVTLHITYLFFVIGAFSSW